MKMINKLMVVLGLAVTLVGCGDPGRVSWGAVNWSPEAAAYLNEHLDKPKGAQSEWALEVTTDNGIRIASVFADDKKTASLVCNPASGVASPVCDVLMANSVLAIRWDESEGYLVGGADLPPMSGFEYVASGEEAVELLADLRPLFLRFEGYAL